MARNKGLRPEHQQFINELFVCWNQTEAYRRVYPESSEEAARRSASDLLTKPDILSEIQRRLRENAMSADEVLKRLAEQARASFEPFLKYDEANEPTLNLASESARRNVHLLKKMTQRRITRTLADDVKETEVITTIELHDSQAALEKLGRHYKLFTDKTEVTGKDGKEIIVKYVNDWREESNH